MLISICIPAYKRVAYLQRLLDSIAEQTCKDFEVIVMDDSPDNSVLSLCNQYIDKYKLQYYKNATALGTPANWNCAISKATGEWIKLMHDDDWFANEHALAAFAKETGKGKKLIFSAYANQYANGTTEDVYLSSFWKKKIVQEPAVLISKNTIGPPSVTLVHSSIKELYDERLKWRVDTEFYYRILKQEKTYCYINQSLINIGISESQVTQSCINQPAIELPEGYLLLRKQGVETLRNMLVYDAWWRLLRNMNIRSKKQLEIYVSDPWPAIVVKMAADLARIPAAILKIGALSKLLMSGSYLKNRKLLKR